MKRFALIAALAVTAVMLNQADVLPSNAEAAPKFLGTLNSDGGAAGPSFVLCLDAGFGNSAVVQVQRTTDIQYCLKTCPTVSCTADCSKDWRPNQELVVRADGGGLVQLVPAPYMTPPIPMFTDRCLNAYGLDGGDPGLKVYLLTGGAGQDYRPER